MRILITRSERYSYSETFIRDQIAEFSKLATVFTIHSGRYPERNGDGKLLSPGIFWVLGKILKIVTGERNNYFTDRGFREYLLKNKIEVVLANYGLSGSHLLPVCRQLNIPLVVIFHGHDATDRKLLKEYDKKYKQLFEHATIVAVSQEMKTRLVGIGASPERIHVVPCGVDPTKFRPSSSKKQKRFVAVGRFVEKKGPLHTIRAFHKAWKKYSDAELVMVGNQKGLYDKCVKLVDELRMQTAVRFTGIQTQAQIRELMVSSLAYVQHSITAANGDMEGTPVSILEAAASGLPVISTFHGGIQDAVIHEKTGFLVKEGDVDKMSDYMVQFIENPEKASEMGMSGRAHIETNYTLENQIRKLYELAADAIDHRLSRI
jgi:colanic acid/amylovoran biosynthesis glycosyltransferase